MKWLKNAYRTVVDHLTKALGIVGMVVMSAIAAINAESIMAAAQTYSAYLGAGVVTKIGWVMFLLVTLRGWYTGYKAKLAAAEHDKLLQDHAALQGQLSTLKAQLDSVRGATSQQSS